MKRNVYTNMIDYVFHVEYAILNKLWLFKIHLDLSEHQ